MKIAQIAPLAESCPPRLYGGTERIVSYLTEELVRQGHDVTLFASGDSVTSAELVPCSKMSLARSLGEGYDAVSRHDAWIKLPGEPTNSTSCTSTSIICTIL